MRKHLLKTFWIALCLLVMPCQVLFAQPLLDLDRASLPARQTYLTQNYGFSISQIQKYEGLLKQRADKIHKIETQLLSSTQRQAEYKRVDNEFLSSLQKQLPASLYQKWYASTKGNQKTRCYKENLGMTGAQIASYNQIHNAYKTEASRISNLKISEKEKGSRLVKW